MNTSFCKWVKEVFHNPNLIQQVSQTFLFLIPNVDKPENMAQFRPIDLCNVSYKIVAKVIATRLREIMPKLVSQTWSSFIPSRQTSDNILVAQEVVYSMRNKKKVKWVIRQLK